MNAGGLVFEIQFVDRLDRVGLLPPAAHERDQASSAIEHRARVRHSLALGSK